MENTVMIRMKHLQMNLILTLTNPTEVNLQLGKWTEIKSN